MIILALLIATAIPVEAALPSAILQCTGEKPKERADLFPDFGQTILCPETGECNPVITTGDRITEAFAVKDGCVAKGARNSFEPLGSGNYRVTSKALNSNQAAIRQMKCQLKGACPAIGTRPADGMAFSLDPTELRRRCEAGQALACGNLGAKYALGEGFPKDDAMAFSFYKKACELGDAERCSRVADFYLTGRATQKDPTSAFQFYKTSCEKGYPEGCIGTAVFASGGNIGDELVAAMPGVLDNMDFWTKTMVPTLEKACNRNLGLACGTLGGLHALGIIFKQDYGPARDFYAKACERGDSTRCERGAELFFKGMGGDKQIERSKRLLEKGCAQKEPECCRILSDLNRYSS